MDKTIPEIILEAIGYIEQGFTKGHMALDSQNKPCQPFDGDAVCYCVEGAVTKATDGYNNDFTNIMDKIRCRVGLNAHIWNDKPERTKEDVINLLQSLINA